MEKKRDANGLLWKRIGHLLSSVCQYAQKRLHTKRTLSHIRLAPLAVLIDGDNMSPEFIAPILLEAEKFGRVTVRRVYGNWSLPSMASWQAILFHYGLTPIHLPSTTVKKNAADIALTVDAMELFHTGMTHFCLVSSDSDFTPLVRRLREARCFLLGIGKPETLDVLKTSCTVFVSTEQLLPSFARAKPTGQPAGPAPSPSPSPAMLPASALPVSGSTLSILAPANAAPPPEKEHIPLPTASTDAHVVALLMTAYQRARAAGRDEWVLTQQIGTFLKQLEPGFDYRAYGSKKLSLLIQKYPDRFQTQTRGVQVTQN